MQWLLGRLSAVFDIPREILQPSLELARARGRSWDAQLIEDHVVEEGGLLRFLAEELGLQYIEDLDKLPPSDLFLEKVPAHFSRKHLLLGLASANGGPMRVVTCHPLDLGPLDNIPQLTHVPVQPCIADRKTLERCVNRAYQRTGGDVAEVLDEIATMDLGDLAKEVEVSGNLMDMAQAAPIVKLVNSIVFQGLRMRASDIHIQPFEEDVMVRLRIDGVLYDIMSSPKKLHDAIISRIKVMGHMDIAERRMPQDGRAFIHYGNHEVDLRISSVPTAFGERIVIRLLDKTARRYVLEDLGMNAQQLEIFDALIHNPHGIIFVTGPTGSGKTTTLYAAIQRLNSSEKNIMTIEDPIEYQLPAISQMEVNLKKGLTFANGLRHLLRQDPDVMMVGEVRDYDTASVATQCAQTGHLVFSTLHTNDAAGAMTRLLDIGVEPFLVASTVMAVLAQRLVRCICAHCREAYRPTDNELEIMGISWDQLPDGKLWRGKGCNECMHTGYWDRTGIYELLLLDDRVRELVMQQEGSSTIKRVAIEAGMKTLRMNGVEKILNGRTTLDEVMQITQRDVL